MKAELINLLKKQINELMISSLSWNNSLFDGKMGVALFAYYINLLAPNERYENYISNSLSEGLKKIEQVEYVDNINFVGEVIGFGWLLQCLVLNNYIQFDVNKILSKIDTVTAKKIIFSEHDMHTSIYILLYYIKRIEFNILKKDKSALVFLRLYVYYAISFINQKLYDYNPLSDTIKVKDFNFKWKYQWLVYILKKLKTFDLKINELEQFENVLWKMLEKITSTSVNDANNCLLSLLIMNDLSYNITDVFQSIKSPYIKNGKAGFLLGYIMFSNENNLIYNTIISNTLLYALKCSDERLSDASNLMNGIAGTGIVASIAINYNIII